MKKIRAVVLMTVVALTLAGGAKSLNAANVSCCDSPDCCADCSGCNK
jgi:heme A synthase